MAGAGSGQRCVDAEDFWSTGAVANYNPREEGWDFWSTGAVANYNPREEDGGGHESTLGSDVVGDPMRARRRPSAALDSLLVRQLSDRRTGSKRVGGSTSGGTFKGERAADGRPHVVCKELLPFKADFHCPIPGSRVPVCEHLCQPAGLPVHGIALFCPGLWGGVGPGRAPGRDFDGDAIYPVAARKVTTQLNLPVDCYRMSWHDVAPELDVAVASVMSVLDAAYTQALMRTCPDNGHRICLCLIGHSFGGAVAYEIASRAAEQDLHVAGGALRLAGVCILNTIVLPTQLETPPQSVNDLSKMCSLVVVGDADPDPYSSIRLYRRLPEQGRVIKVLPGGTHDLHAHKGLVVDEISQFIAKQFSG